MRGLVIICLLVVTIPSSYLAQTEREHQKVLMLQATRIDSKITVDGELNEDAWGTTEIVSHFVQKDPDEGKEASERTELRIAYDDSALYVGVRLYDQHAQSIIRRLSRRDDNSDSDRFTLYLDARHDHLTGALFEISAAGVQRDAIISNDNFTDYSWDGIWESAVSVDDAGWCA